MSNRTVGVDSRAAAGLAFFQDDKTESIEQNHRPSQPWRQLWRVISCLTAGEDRTAVVCWICLVDKDKSRSSAVCDRWRRACPGFACYSLGGLLANAVLAFVLELLIKLTIQTTAGGLSHSQNQATISALNECGKKKNHLTSRGMPSGSKHPARTLAVLKKLHDGCWLMSSATELKISTLPHLSTHTPDSLLKSFMPSGQKQPSVVKSMLDSLGLELKKEKG